MRRQFLDVPDAQPGGGEDLRHRAQRQVGEVLVIDGVELRLCEQMLQVRELESDVPSGLAAH